MLKYTAHKLLVATLVAITVSFVAFMLLRLSGDLASAMAEEAANGEDIARIRLQLGLDRPLVTQYWEWASRAVTGDFGKSFYFPESVWTLLAQRLPVTLTLACWGLALSLAVGIDDHRRAGAGAASLLARPAVDRLVRSDARLVADQRRG
jgi:peptide/nickel transport system permease protein